MRLLYSTAQDDWAYCVWMYEYYLVMYVCVCVCACVCGRAYQNTSARVGWDIGLLLMESKTSFILMLSSPRLVALLWLNSSLISNLSIVGSWREGFMSLPVAFRDVKRKQVHPGFEIGSPIKFPDTITNPIKLQVPFTFGLVLFGFMAYQTFLVIWCRFLYIYIKYMISIQILLITFLNEHMVKRFKVLLFNTNNSIKHLSSLYTKLNDRTFLFQT